jgi:hypothetical protein
MTSFGLLESNLNSCSKRLLPFPILTDITGICNLSTNVDFCFIPRYQSNGNPTLRRPSQDLNGHPLAFHQLQNGVSVFRLDDPNSREQVISYIRDFNATGNKDISLPLRASEVKDAGLIYVHAVGFDISIFLHLISHIYTLYIIYNIKNRSPVLYL